MSLILDPCYRYINSYCLTTITVTIDKPTRDELIELLSSSMFTAGTWEQFVCCLPNMTQEINILTSNRERRRLILVTLSLLLLNNALIVILT